MTKRKPSRRERGLIVGFTTISALYVLLGALALYQVSTLSRMARTIHDHPLMVSSAALSVKSAVTKLHCNVMDILYMNSFKGIESLLSRINDHENEVVASLDIVRDRILTGKGRQLEKETRELFYTWESIRWEIIALISEQRRKDAVDLIKGTGGEHLRLMENKAQELSDHSRATATKYLLRSESMNSRMIIITLVVLGFSIPFVLAVTVGAIRSVMASERSSRESEERYILTQRIGRIGMFEWNMRDNTVFLADETKDIIGILPGEFQGKAAQILPYVHPDDMAKWQQGIKACKEEGRELKLDIRSRRPGEDKDIWLSVLGEASLGPDGRARRLLGVVMDITERKHSEVRHQELEKQLIQSQKMEAIGRLAGGVAHDFNNLLSIILGYSEMLMDDIPYDHPFHTSLSEVHDAAVRAQGVTRQLLAFGRKQVLEIKQLDLNRVILNVEKLLRRAMTEDIVFQIFPTQDSAMIRADNAQLEQVLMNLVVNAKDAMPNGGELSIETSLEDLDETSMAGTLGLAPGRYVLLAVSDTGHGIAPESQDQIFEPFFSTKGKEKGTGLGLATVYGIITQHGGTVAVHSEKGQGTTFKIYLPLSRTAEMADIGPKTESTPSNGNPATILVVEDDEALARLAFRLLEKHGFNVLASENAQDAVNIAQHHEGTIDLLLTDVIMPGMKGPEVYEKIKVFHPGIRVLYMSGYTGDVINPHGVLKENIHFLQKPFSKKMLLEKINETMGSPHES